MSERSNRRRVSGGFAFGDIPRGFERVREPHADAPLSRRGKVLFYSIVAAVVVGGAVLAWFAATR